MRPFLDWLESRWRTRGEYAVRLRGFASRWLVPLGVRVAGALAVIAAFLFVLYWVLGAPSRAGARAMRIEALRDSLVAAVSSNRADAAASLDDLVARDDRAARLQDASVRLLRWRGSTLDVESDGHGWIGPPGQPGSESLTIRVRFSLDVSGNGIREIARDVVTYVRR